MLPGAMIATVGIMLKLPRRKLEPIHGYCYVETPDIKKPS